MLLHVNHSIIQTKKSPFLKRTTKYFKNYVADSACINWRKKNLGMWKTQFWAILLFLKKDRLKILHYENDNCQSYR